MSLNVGVVSATAELNMRRFSQGMKQMQHEGARGSRNVQGSLDGIGSRLTNIAFLAQAVLGSALVIGAKKAVNEFALLEGSMAKFEVVFADQSREMERWVGTIRERMPLANREIIAAAASMQDLLVPMGIAREQATGMTQQWLELAAALAAFNDVPVDQALEAIRSGIAGQSRPLRQFGIDVRETALQQTALENGLIKSGEAMNENARQQALLIQAYAQSKDAIDGYEDQLGSTLIMEQNLAATYKDTAAMIGKTLQPAYNRMIASMTSNLKIIQNLFGGFSKLFDDVEAGMKRAFQDDSDMVDMQKTMSLLSEAIERTELQLRRSGGAKEYADRLDHLNRSAVELQAIITLLAQQDPFDQMAGSARSLPPTVGDLLGQITELEGKIRDSFDPEQIGRYQHQIRALEIDVAKLTGTFESLKPAMENIQPVSHLFDENMFPPIMSDLAHTEELIGNLIEGWNDLDDSTISFAENTGEATGAARFFSRTLGDGLDQILFRAQSVEDAIKGIIRQLASRALVTGLMALFSGGLPQGVSFGRAMFGGTFHTGGIVGGTGEKMVRVQGGEGVFTPAQMKAMGSGGGSSISLTVNVTGGTQISGNDLRYVIDEQVRQIVRLQ